MNISTGTESPSISRYSKRATRPSGSIDSPMKNCSSLKRLRISFITLFMLVLKSSTWSGDFSSNFSTNLFIKLYYRICRMFRIIYIDKRDRERERKILFLKLTFSCNLLNIKYKTFCQRRQKFLEVYGLKQHRHHFPLIHQCRRQLLPQMG